MSNKQVAPEGLARGSEHDPLAREQGNDSGRGDLGRYRQARVTALLPTPANRPFVIKRGERLTTRRSAWV